MSSKSHKFASMVRMCFLALAVGLVWVGSARADCAALRSAAEADQGRTEALMALYEQVAVEPSCDEAFRTQFGRLVARSVEKEVFKAVSSGQALAQFEPRLSQSLRYARQWRVLAWLGDIARERRTYEASCSYYQEALTVIQDETATPNPPPHDVIERIFHLAEQTRMLGKKYVAATKTRAGTPSGLAAVSVRGYTPQRVSLPIEFEFNSVLFTDKGRSAADDLLGQMRQDQSPASVTLVGHTDPRGSDIYNQKLSLQRAEALRNFLVGNGVQASIRVEGRGSSDPPRFLDDDKYTQDERYQIARRVEFVR